MDTYAEHEADDAEDDGDEARIVNGQVLRPMYHRYTIRVRRYRYGDMAIREFKKRHSGSIERVSEYRSIEVSDTQVSDTSTAGLVKYR